MAKFDFALDGRFGAWVFAAESRSLRAMSIAVACAVRLVTRE